MRWLEFERSCEGEVRERLTFRALERPLERLRGLLGTETDAEPVALLGCHNIHTFGMRYRLDVAFVAANGAVLDVRLSVPPGKLLGDERAWAVLERPHRRGPWLRVGEQLWTCSHMRMGERGDARR